MTTIVTENFLLHSTVAIRLYHEYAKSQPIFDYHCHLPVAQIANNQQFRNLTEIWLAGDHYKWRAMRAAGIDESLITGNASDWEKFEAWASVFPKTIRNPLFHWSLLELNRPFGINDRYLSPATARSIWEECETLLARPEFSARGIMKQFDVRFVCTTDDPADTLEYHRQLAQERTAGTFDIPVYPTFRPDSFLPLDCTAKQGTERFLRYLQRLESIYDTTINSFESLCDMLILRHDYFDACGCHLSDHGFGLFRWLEPDYWGDQEASFAMLLAGETISQNEAVSLASELLYRIGVQNARRGWTMQLHIGAMRNNRKRLFDRLGPDVGCDSIADGFYAHSLSRFFDYLDRDGSLPKTIVYNLNPSANAMLAALVANFNDGTTAGKMQFGSGWWFLDQKQGIEDQLDTASNMGLLSLFIGMLTDSRSFLSYTRHEYFRRILCNRLGEEMENGLLPNDFDWIGSIVSDICWNNAKNYFGEPRVWQRVN